ncbi:MAG: N-acetyltransferase [Thermoleophilaceae bacterium]|nr:N-acetyltransferase [Thermoleophilaceae bacterium]
MPYVRDLSFGSLAPDSRAPNLLVGSGVEIHPTAQIGANVVIYDDVTIDALAVVKHNCVIGESPTLAIDTRAVPQPKVRTVIEAGAMICNGVVMISGCRIGSDTIIGDQSFVREGAVVAEDCVIGRGCSIGVGASIGRGTKIQNNSIVMPGMVIEADVFIGAMLSGATDDSIGRDPDLAQQAVTVRRGARIGSSVCLLPGIEIGEEAFIGAGAVVLDSVPPRAKVAGVPARTIGVVADEETL